MRARLVVYRAVGVIAVGLSFLLVSTVITRAFGGTNWLRSVDSILGNVHTTPGLNVKNPGLVSIVSSGNIPITDFVVDIRMVGDNSYDPPREPADSITGAKASQHASGGSVLRVKISYDLVFQSVRDHGSARNLDISSSDVSVAMSRELFSGDVECRLAQSDPSTSGNAVGNPITVDVMQERGGDLPLPEREGVYSYYQDLFSGSLYPDHPDGLSGASAIAAADEASFLTIRLSQPLKQNGSYDRSLKATRDGGRGEITCRGSASPAVLERGDDFLDFTAPVIVGRSDFSLWPYGVKPLRLMVNVAAPHHGWRYIDCALPGESAVVSNGFGWTRDKDGEHEIVAGPIYAVYEPEEAQAVLTRQVLAIGGVFGLAISVLMLAVERFVSGLVNSAGRRNGVDRTRDSNE